MTIDPRTPVIVGVGQCAQKFADPAAGAEPIELLTTATRAALDDAGRPLPIDTIAVPEILSWRYPDPGAFLARRLGIDLRTSIATNTGGNTPQTLVNRLAAGIQRGENDAVIIGGVECMYSRRRARRVEPPVHLEWTLAEDPDCPTVWGDPRFGTNEYEIAHGLVAPTTTYPLFETALRHRAGRSVAEHQQAIGELWSHFAAVGAENPDAWSPRAWTATEIATPDADNRIVCFPYTKRMCANLDVDQAAAIVMTSYGSARAAGIPADRLVFPQAGADAHDHFYISERRALAAAPAIGIAVRAALDAAATDLDAVSRFDIYSCFPAAVQLALESLGLAGPLGGDERPLTVTGGLAFAGGPGNNYVTHSIAAMVEACRNDPGSVGLVTGLGWYATKHSVGVYSSTPPAAGFRAVDPATTQAQVDALPRREGAGPYEGPAEVEATSIVFDRDGSPTLGIVSLLTPDGRRAFARGTDPDTLTAMATTAWEGTTVRVRTSDETNLID